MKQLDVLAKADVVYLEQFTSPISKSDLAKIKKMPQRRIQTCKKMVSRRWK